MNHPVLQPNRRLSTPQDWNPVAFHTRFRGSHGFARNRDFASFSARRTINPVAVILSLIFWYWMWGVPGAILAVPMLAIIKIICDRLRPFRAFGHLLEG